MYDLLIYASIGACIISIIITLFKTIAGKS